MRLDKVTHRRNSLQQAGGRHLGLPGLVVKVRASLAETPQ
jgi:hypothetical protein